MQAGHFFGIVVYGCKDLYSYLLIFYYKLESLGLGHGDSGLRNVLGNLLNEDGTKGHKNPFQIISC